MKKVCSIGWVLVVLLSITACGDLEKEEESENPELAALEEEIDTLEAAIKDARAEKKKLSADIKGWERSLKGADNDAEEADELRQDLANWKGYRERIAAAHLEAESHLEVWRKFVRQRLVGRELGNVLLADNSVLQGATVVSVSEEAAVLRHQGGEATVPLEDLPEEIRLKLFHEPTMDAKGGASVSQ